MGQPSLGTRRRAPDGQRSEREKGHVLVAQSDEDELSLTLRGLHDAGWNPRGVLSIEEARHALDEGAFDAFVTDSSLGPDCVFDVLETDSHVPETTIPVVGLTGHSVHGRAELAACMGLDALLTKPVPRGALAEVLRGLTARGAQNDRP